MTDSSVSADLKALRIDRSKPPPKRGRRTLKLGAIVGALVLGGGGLAWLYPKLESRIFKAEVELTEISFVSPSQSTALLTSTGYVVPEIASKVGTQVQGRIAEVRVKEGDDVKKGDLLVLLDSSKQKSAIAAANAQVLSARARAQNARAGLNEVQQQLDRQKKLADQGVLAESIVEDLQAKANTLNETVNVAEAELKAAQSHMRAYRVDLDLTEIRAPIDGTVVSRPLDPGEMIGLSLEQDSIVELADLDSLVVETDVPEARLGRIRIGGPAEITLDAFAGKRFRGEVLEVRPRVNRAKATVPVKVKFVDDVEGVLPDMSARVSFLSEAIKEEALGAQAKLVVPAEAVTKRQGSHVVFVLENGKVRMRTIKLGKSFANGFVLESGPDAGTQVVVDPPDTLRDGQKIKERSGD